MLYYRCLEISKKLDSPVIVHLLDQWYDNSTKGEREYRRAILEALNEKKEKIVKSEMTRIYQDKAFSARDLLMDYFMHNGFEK